MELASTGKKGKVNIELYINLRVIVARFNNLSNDIEDNKEREKVVQ